MIPVTMLQSHHKLHYGFGLFPYCNITDQADRSLPVFGPIQLGKPRAFTPFFCDWRISAVLPSAGKLYQLARPDTSDQTLGWHSRHFTSSFAHRHLEWMHQAPQDNLALYASRFKCPEKMPLILWLGYDGPVKIWVDRKMIFHDPNGINPADIDAQHREFQATKGVHEIIIALGSNNGLAWGVFARLERPDVPAKLLRKGTSAYVMPQILG